MPAAAAPRICRPRLPDDVDQNENARAASERAACRGEGPGIPLLMHARGKDSRRHPFTETVQRNDKSAMRRGKKGKPALTPDATRLY